MHDDIEKMPINWHQRAILHALVELGLLDVLECKVENCVIGDRQFDFSKKPTRLEIDHIIPRSEGGSDRLENLRPAHKRCNLARMNPDPQGKYTWERRSETQKKNWSSGQRKDANFSEEQRLEKNRKISESAKKGLS